MKKAPPGSINLESFINDLQREALNEAFNKDNEPDEMKNFMKDLISDLNADNSVIVPTDKTNGCINMKLE